MWASAFQPGGSLDHLRSWAEQMRLATSASNAARLLEIGWNADVRDAARKLKCPVLVAHPERDSVAPVEEGRLLAGLISDSRFIQLDSQNHMPLLDEAEWPRLVQEMRKFLSEPGRDNADSLRSISSRPANALCLKQSLTALTMPRLPKAWAFGKDRAQSHHPRIRQDSGAASLPGDRSGARCRSWHADRSTVIRDGCPGPGA
jgi:hypothetical protein